TDYKTHQLAWRVNQLRRYAFATIASRRRPTILSDPAFGFLLLHEKETQAPAWLPVNGLDIDLAARLRSNGRSRTRRIPGTASRRIPGMATRQIRQRCTPHSNSDKSCLAAEFRLS